MANDAVDTGTRDPRVDAAWLATRMTTTAVIRGRAALTQQWANRPADLVTRHVYTNLLVTEVSETEAKGQSVGIGYRHVGPDFGLPVAPIFGPAVVVLSVNEKNHVRVLLDGT